MRVLKKGAVPGACFGAAPVPARALAPGLGLAVARRGIFRADDQEDFGCVADRVAAGNIALLGDAMGEDALQEKGFLRNAIACGALLTAGRHLVRGDPSQPEQPMEFFVNCATAAASFTCFYLLLCGAGVGRAYDDALCLVDWRRAPRLFFNLAPDHADFTAASSAQRAALSEPAPDNAQRFVIPDSREGWAEALEVLEAIAHAGQADQALVLDFSAIRPSGQPIQGFGGRPAPGPLPLLAAFLALRAEVMAAPQTMPRWEQALRVDDIMARAVLYGGARRAARMAAKTWRDADAPRFAAGLDLPGHAGAAYALLVNADFWARLGPRAKADEPATHHAHAVFQAASAAIHQRGEPGFINADHLVHTTLPDPDTRFGSARFPMIQGAALVSDIAIHARGADFPAITNPCGEVALPITGGFCVVADVAPLLACPIPLEEISPGALPVDVAEAWDARVVTAIRLGVRFLIRLNRMQGIYDAEIRASNRIGIGLTGIFEWAWLRFGLRFEALITPDGGRDFWRALARLSASAKREARDYAQALGMTMPATVTTIKPAGTTSLLFGLSAGAHPPAAAQYLRWVRYEDARAASALAAAGYPMRHLPSAHLVGFPTQALLAQLDQVTGLITSGEMSLAEQYRWIALLERHWIGAHQGNQVSCTLNFDADEISLADLRKLLRRHQPKLRAAALLPRRVACGMAPAIMPEEAISAAEYAALMGRIKT
jgi:adenosylcobalamin-dependent ribonucleoside-triphosphate reductase